MADNDVTRIAGNIGAINALYALNNINKQLSIHSTRLATGKRLNSAADDPAGLAISSKMMARSEGLKVALSNIGDAKNLLAVAESGLGRLNDILIQMSNKAETGASDTMGSTERDIIKTQLLSYAAQIDDIVNQTKWNGNTLINGDYASTALTFHTGAGQGEVTKLTGLENVSAAALGLVTNIASSNLGSTVWQGGTALSSSGLDNGIAGRSLYTTSGGGMTELPTGQYRMKVTIGHTNGSTLDSTVELYDSDNNIVMVDADSVPGGALDNKQTFNYNTSFGANLEFGNGLWFHITTGVVAGVHANQTITYNQVLTTDINTNDANSYSTYLDTVSAAIVTVNQQLSRIGSLSSSLSFKEDQISAAQINIEASYNRIMNANMAEEQVNASKLSILQQTSTAMLSQANMAPQFLLSLFK